MPEDRWLPEPEAGEIYTIDAAEEDDEYVSGACIWLVGFPDDAGYDVGNFRPLINTTDEAKERDAEMFREWLNVHDALPVRERALLVEASEGGSGV